MLITELAADKCYVVYANSQGPKKGKQCDHMHEHNTEKGDMVQLTCDVDFHVFIPKYDDNGMPSSNMMAIICFGEHTHPPPPQRRCPPDVKDALIRLIQAFRPSEATARRLIASPMLPLMLNGKTSLSQEHIALTNQSVVNHLIQKERYKEYPHGTDFMGALHLTDKQNPDDPYVRKCIYIDNRQYIILCQSKQQSELFFQSTEIQCDKTFACTKCREFEINGYSHETSQITTLSRVFTNEETATGYEQAFTLAFQTAEENVGLRIPWGHLEPYSDREFRIKAVLLDMHSGQMHGLGRYFVSKYPSHEDANWHIPRIVKVCQVHFMRSIKKLRNSGNVPESMSCCDHF